MMLECPHCYRRVGVNRDGICPCCQHDVYDETGVDLHLATVWITPETVIPPNCALCGMQTEHTTSITNFGAYEIKPERDVEDVSIGSILRLVLGPFSSLLRLAVFLVTREAAVPDRAVTKSRFTIPRCEACGKSEIQLIDCNHERNRMKLLVHRRFKEAVDEANQVPELE